MSKARLYYNPSYQGCDDQPCYFIYIQDGGMYIISPNTSYKVLETPTFELTDENIDSYAKSRGFIKVLNKNDNISTDYLNGFESPE